MLFLLVAAVTIDATWLLAAGFLAALGAAVWKFIPWAIHAALGDVIEHQVRPMIETVGAQVDSVNARIDSHMDHEEAIAEAQAADLGAMRTQLTERTVHLQTLQDTLDRQIVHQLQVGDSLVSHVDADAKQFETIMGRLDEMESPARRRRK